MDVLCIVASNFCWGSVFGPCLFRTCDILVLQSS